MKILIVPNAFKGSLSAIDASEAIAKGFESSDLDCEVIQIPIADGGDGSLPVIVSHLDAKLKSVMVKNPKGEYHQANYGVTTNGKMAIIEMSEVSGIRKVQEKHLDPWKLTSYGTGELILSSINSGCKEILLTLGGSATVDAGIGILHALGVEFITSSGESLTFVDMHHMADVKKIDCKKAFLLLEEVKLTILVDVEIELLGNEGAAKIFGPQKGLKVQDISIMEAFLLKIAQLVENETNKDITNVAGGGAAGGVAATLYGLFNAQIKSGAEEILRLSGFYEALKECDLVVTGEGNIDEQTAFGKGPGFLARKAFEANVPVIGLSGTIDLNQRPIKNFNAIFPIINQPSDLTMAMKHTFDNLMRTAEQIGNLLSATSAVKKL